MKKFSNTAFFTSLFIWFVSSAYLSINYIINFFIETNPYISKYISIFSFISMLVFAIYNRYVIFETNKKINSETNPARKERALKKPKCAACGKK